MYVEFAREKIALFDKWCTANKVVNFGQLKEFVLLDEFKNCISYKIVIYLNEQKVSSLGSVLTDEFVLTDKTVFSSLWHAISDCTVYSTLEFM